MNTITHDVVREWEHREMRFRAEMDLIRKPEPSWPGPVTRSVSFHRPGAPRCFCQRCGRNEDYTACPDGARICINCNTLSRDGFVPCRDESPLEASDRRQQEKWRAEIAASREAPVDLSGLLGTPSQDLAQELPVDSVLPGECYYCKSKATHTKGSGEPLCRYHKQFFWSKPIREEDETCKS